MQITNNAPVQAIPAPRPAAAPATAPAPTSPVPPSPGSALPGQSGIASSIPLSSLPPVSSLPPSTPIEGRTFTTWGDPHEVSGDGLKFENQEEGDIVKVRSREGDFEVQTHQEHWGWNDALINTKAAVKLGKDVVSYDLNTDTLVINGQPRKLNPGETVELPSGGTITAGSNDPNEQFMGRVPAFVMESPAGDKVKLYNAGDVAGKYIDIVGELSPNRAADSVYGSLGTFDADSDANNDLVGPDGRIYAPEQAAEFIKAWKVQPGESLLDGSLTNKPRHVVAPRREPGAAPAPGGELELLKGLIAQLGKGGIDPDVLKQLEEMLARWAAANAA